jgi:hypothetical protein
MKFKILLLSFIFYQDVFSQGNLILSNNLLNNYEFQNRDIYKRPAGWITGNELQTTLITNAKKRGRNSDDNSLQLLDTSSFLSLVVRSERCVAAPTVMYIASAWNNYENGDLQELHLEFWDQDNKIIREKVLKTQPVSGWKKYELKEIAPDKTCYVTISMQSLKESKGNSYWDEASLQYEIEYTPLLLKGKRELFADNYRIENMLGVERIVHEGQKSKPVIIPDKPWEGRYAYHYGTVLKQAGLYRLWYVGISKEKNREKYFTLYAYSKDGMNWKKPELGLYDFEGVGKKNNIVPLGGSLIYDRFEKDSAKRYKMMAMVEEDKAKNQKKGYGVFFSGDGLNWKPYEKNPVLGYSDVSNVAYDEEKRLFIAATKQRLDYSSITPNKLDRAAFISVSDDFINWHAPGTKNSLWALAVDGDMQDDLLVQSRGGIEAQVYGMPVIPYEGIYFGVPWIFEIKSYSSGEWAYWGDGRVYPQLAFSRDLKTWSRPARTPLISLGKEGAWDAGAIYTSSSIVVNDKTVDMYFGGMNVSHGGSRDGRLQGAKIAKATWRRDGFVSLVNGGNDAGFITTRPFLFNAEKLKVNCRLNTGGFLKVALLDREGKVIPGFATDDCLPVTGDQYGKEIKWKNNKSITSLSGSDVKMLFTLKGGDFYSFWFE